MSRRASQATKPVPMPKTAVHPLEVVRRGCFDWWSLAVIAVVVTFAVTFTVLLAL